MRGSGSFRGDGVFRRDGVFREGRPCDTASPRRRKVRLTLRGRAVLLVAAIGGAMVGVLLAGPAPAVPVTPASGGATPTSREVAVVRPGDTLWSVAARHVPSRDAPGVIEEIRQLNGLQGTVLQPGQQLVLPER